MKKLFIFSTLVLLITSCGNNQEKKFVYGLDSKKLVHSTDLNQTGTNYANGNDHQNLKFGDTVILETILESDKQLSLPHSSLIGYNVYYEDAYDMSDIRNGEHLKNGRRNKLEKAVVLPMMQARAMQVK